MQQTTDPYRALGVARGATEVEIKAAHRKLVKRYHPDTGTKSEPERFLRVQEAYRVLSDPLLRKDWDQTHAPGPVRADRPTTATPRRRRPPAPKAATEASETPPQPREPAAEPEPDPRTRPRSSRAYTWSASDVPWWEEARTDRKQSAESTGKVAADASDTDSSDAAVPPPADEPIFGQQDFDVYNRSSGAAWSMAARAYFRKGEQDLPRRGSFRHEGTQVVTAGRARTAAESEARRRAAAAAAAAANVAGVRETFARSTAHAASHAAPHAAAPSAPGPREGTTHIVRRSLAAPWPSISMRFGLALIAWLPIAAVTAVAFADTIDQLMAMAFIAAALLLLIAVPRVAYVAALATVLVLFIGGIFIGGILLAGALPSADRLATYLGGLLVVGYVATAAVVVIGPSTLRPWTSR